MISQKQKDKRAVEDARYREAVRIFYETGSEDSLGPMLAELRPRLVALLRSKTTLSIAVVEDIVQMALVRILKAIRKDQLKAITNATFFTWAGKVAWSALSNHLRTESCHGQPSAPGSEEDPFLIPDSALSVPPQEMNNPEDDAHASALLKAATQAVMSLDPNARNAVVLFFYHGLTPAAAADQIGIHVNHFMRRLERGIEVLRGWGAQQNAPTPEIYAALSRVNTGDLFREPGRQTHQ